MRAVEPTPTPKRREPRLPLRSRLVHSLELPVLGLPVLFESNEQQVIEAVDEAFGTWRGTPQAEQINGGPSSRGNQGPPLSVRITVRDDRAFPGGRLRHVVPDATRLFVSSADAVGYCSAASRRAVAGVSRQLIEDREQFRIGVLEALTLGLLTRCDRQPLHAAAVVRDVAALLLVGPSGAGKSTLALAAADAGLAVMAEDIVFLQSRPHIRAWGMAGFVRVRACPDQPARHPDSIGQRIGDDGKIRVRLDHDSARPAMPMADRIIVCVLADRRPEPTLQRITGPEAMAAIDFGTAGFHVFAGSIRPVLQRLTGSGAWRLHTGPCAAASIPLLLRMLDEQAESAGALRLMTVETPVRAPGLASHHCGES
jgi:hypothetical protein